MKDKVVLTEKVETEDDGHNIMFVGDREATWVAPVVGPINSGNLPPVYIDVSPEQQRIGFFHEKAAWIVRNVAGYKLKVPKGKKV